MKNLVLIAALLWPLAVQANCRQALVLALDVSGSVDAREYALQRDGVATALNSAAVRALLLSEGAAPTRLAIFEWSGPEDQSLIVPWTEIAQTSDLDQAIARIRGHQRQAASPTTAIGSAMQVGFDMLAQHPDCWKHTLDISGDGEANTGPRPQFVSLAPAPSGTLVNGLVIGSGDNAGGDDRGANIRELSSYFSAYVVRGPGAFVEVAIGFEDYAQAMERKLIRELGAIAIGAITDQ